MFCSFENCKKQAKKRHICHKCQTIYCSRKCLDNDYDKHKDFTCKIIYDIGEINKNPKVQSDTIPYPNLLHNFRPASPQPTGHINGGSYFK